MPTRDISLTPEQDAFIEKVLDNGEYRNASEAISDAIRALQQLRALHVIFYRGIEPGLIEIVRVVHERMEAGRYLGSNHKP